MKRFGSLVATAAFTKADDYNQTSKGFVYDYCSIGHSLDVYEDTANNFNEVFGGYDVPMDASVCPFHADNLAFIRESQSLANWSNAKVSTSLSITCPICTKTFKSQDFYALHMKTAHSNF